MRKGTARKWSVQPRGRRREVMRMLTCGHSPDAIAEMLGVSPRELRRMVRTRA